MLMSAAASPSELLRIESASADAHRLSRIRAEGAVAITAKRDGAITRIEALAESGGYRAKFPTPSGSTLEASIVNTGGGVAGGDTLDIDITVRTRARLAVTTPSAERIYRSLGEETRINAAFTLEAGADLTWAPQATIVFSGARLKRSFKVELADTARLLMAETVVFGRRDSGEVMGFGLFQDRWEISRGGKLIFAEATRLDGNLGAALARPAVMGPANIRANIAAIIVCIAPNVGERLDAVRTALQTTSTDAGASSWNGMLVVRALGDRLDRVQASISAAISALDVPRPQTVLSPEHL